MASAVHTTSYRENDQNRYEATKQALNLLFTLLEAYAPPWYTEEHREKAQAVLS